MRIRTALFGLATAGILFAGHSAHAQTIYPIDRASFLAGTRFDFKVEFTGVVDQSATKVTINGRDAAAVLGGTVDYIAREDGQDASSLLIRGATLPQPGSYTIAAEGPGQSRTVTWDVYGTPSTPRVKNVILFIGDGMSVAHVTAARILSRQLVEGKYRGRLAIDDFPYNSMVGTSGVDSVATDSANSAHAYTTGHKSSVNALGVYASRAKDNLAHPRVETIAELLKRTTTKSVGVVTNTEIEDATPASMVAHTRRRSDYNVIVDQFLALKPDVMMGGGASNFVPKSAPGSRRTDEEDYLAKFREAGYAVAATAEELNAAAARPETRRLLGLFHPRNMDGALDRKILKGSTVKQYPNQPDLTEQVKAGIDVLSRNPEGFFMMVESGLIDKATHPLDWERAVYDTIMLDNAVKVAVDWAGNREDTLIIVIPDHAHGISIIGTIDDDLPGTEMREKVGVYDKARFPNYPAPNAEGYPEKVDVSRRLAVFVNNYPDYYETFRPKLDATNVPAIQGPDKKYVANEKYKSVAGAMFREGILPRDADQGVHSADDVVARGWGPGSEMLRGFIDNTYVFRIIATNLALGPAK